MRYFPLVLICLAAQPSYADCITTNVYDLALIAEPFSLNDAARLSPVGEAFLPGGPDGAQHRGILFSELNDPHVFPTSGRITAHATPVLQGARQTEAGRDAASGAGSAAGPTMADAAALLISALLTAGLFFAARGKRSA